MPSFSCQLPNIMKSGPIVEVLVGVSPLLANVLKEKNQPMPKPIKLVAMFDTGATSTVVQDGIPQKLGLQPVGTANIATPTTESHLCHQYNMGITFPNNVHFSGVFMAAPLRGQPIQCLLGRDIMARGVFVYIGFTNQFTFSI